MEMREHALALVTEIYLAAFEVTIFETAPFPYTKLKLTVMGEIFTLYGSFSSSLLLFI